MGGGRIGHCWGLLLGRGIHDLLNESAFGTSGWDQGSEGTVKDCMDLPFPIPYDWVQLAGRLRLSQSVPELREGQGRTRKENSGD